MGAVDWAGLSFLAVLFVGCVGYLSRQIDRRSDDLRNEIVPRLDRLEERYVRHLELHAGHNA